MSDDEDFSNTKINNSIISSNVINNSQNKIVKVTEKNKNEKIVNLLYKQNDIDPFLVYIEKIETIQILVLNKK